MYTAFFIGGPKDGQFEMLPYQQGSYVVKMLDTPPPQVMSHAWNAEASVPEACFEILVKSYRWVPLTLGSAQCGVYVFEELDDEQALAHLLFSYPQRSKGATLH